MPVCNADSASKEALRKPEACTEAHEQVEGVGTGAPGGCVGHQEHQEGVWGTRSTRSIRRVWVHEH